ncbi:MAG: glycosyltransferase family 2 protein [bacterium]
MSGTELALLPRTLILIPAYDEARSVGDVIQGVRRAAPASDVLVIDDGSRDRTALVARTAGALVLRHPFNLGHGAALQTGYRYAREHGYAFVIQLDADGQHDPRDVVTIAAALADGTSDIVLGSRFLAGACYPISIVRRAAIRFFASLVRVLTGCSVTDPTTGFQGLARAAFTFYCDAHFPADFPDADVIVMADRAGLRLREVAVRMYAPPPGRTMHAGWIKLYYVFKQLVSLGMVVLATGWRRGSRSAATDAGAAASLARPAASAAVLPRTT